MVVKLFFTNGSSSIRSFSDEELVKLKLTDSLKDYFSEHLNPDFPIDTFEIFDIKKYPSDDYNLRRLENDYNLRTFDYRDYFNYSKSFIGLEIDGCVVERVEFFDNNSYEYGLDSLDGEPYERGVIFNYTMDHYYYSKGTVDPENWEKDSRK
jgi:hypothetical protein